MKPSTTNSSKPQRQPKLTTATTTTHVDPSTVAPVSTARSTDTDSLVVHSGPIQLATRSLSARGITSTAHCNQATTDSEHSLTHRPLTSGSTSRKKQKLKHDSKKKTESSKRKVVEPLDISEEKGFNLADHLRESADNDCHGRSSSPSVHQLLQDISSIMRAVSPIHEPPPSTMQSQPEPHQGSGDARQRKEKKERGGSPKQSRKANLRSRVVANFNLETAGEQGRANGVLLHGKDDTHAFSDVPSSERNKHHSSKVKPGIPHLNFGGSDQLEVKISVEGAHEVKNSSSLDGGHHQTEDRGSHDVDEPSSTLNEDTENQDHTVMTASNGMQFGIPRHIFPMKVVTSFPKFRTPLYSSLCLYLTIGYSALPMS